MFTATATDRFLGRCEACVRPIGVEVPDRFGDYVSASCPECTGPVTLERLYGTITSQSCDPLCEGAIGRVCLCSCGGRNHGGLYFETGTALASAIEKHRSTTTKRRQAAAARSERKAALKAEEKAAAWSAYVEANADVLARLTAYAGSNDFLLDLARQHDGEKMLTERQLEAAGRSFEREAAFEARKAAEAATAAECPEGTQVLDGVILSTRVDDGYMGGAVVKMLVKCAGFKVWGTVPASLYSSVRRHEELIGSRVRFTATVTRSNDDASFGFYSRPRKAELIEEEVSAA